MKCQILSICLHYVICSSQYPICSSQYPICSSQCPICSSQCLFFLSSPLLLSISQIVSLIQILPPLLKFFLHYSNSFSHSSFSQFLSDPYREVQKVGKGFTTRYQENQSWYENHKGEKRCKNWESNWLWWIWYWFEGRSVFVYQKGSFRKCS